MQPTRPRILIVDDQAANVAVLAEALGEAYELFAATSAERALELAEAGVDLILLDVLMPGRSGFEVCLALKNNEQTRGIPVIFVTALGDVEDEARGFDFGGVDYITKPISPPTVRARVRTHLELRGAQQRLEKEAEVLAENLRLKEHVERLSRHDLKTPLASVISIPQILLETPGLTSDQARMLRAVEAAGYRILDMINRSLDLFRMESRAYEFQPTRVDMGELVERVATDLASLTRAREVDFSLPPRRDHDRILAAAEELLSYSMLANLMKNAVEAAPPKSQVRVELSARDGEVLLAVHNLGAVPLALRESFFRKYASAGKKSGSGLGTYSARLMAETQGGRIEMWTSDEEGTTLRVYLKQAPAASAGALEPRAVTSEIRRSVLPSVRILIVDDDEPTRFVLARFLAGAAALDLAVDGGDALQKVSVLDPTVVFLDAEMPGLGGFATAAKLREMEAAQPSHRRFLVGMSAHDDAAARDAFRNAGCDMVLVKPLTRQTALEAVEASLAGSLPYSSGTGVTPAPVEIDADLFSLIPSFLVSRREQAEELIAALAGQDFDAARALAHKLRGGLEMCGFAFGGALSRSIEESLTSRPPLDGVKERAQALRNYLDHVQYQAKTQPSEGDM